MMMKVTTDKMFRYTKVDNILIAAWLEQNGIKFESVQSDDNTLKGLWFKYKWTMMLQDALDEYEARVEASTYNLK